MRELTQLSLPPMTDDEQQPRRTLLPVDLLRLDVHHEPESTTCARGCFSPSGSSLSCSG